MSKRVYNIMFHTHTISGIIISAALYVIFFTGSISFLRDEIIAWERNEPVTDNYFSEVDFDSLLKYLEEDHELRNRDVSFNQRIEGQMASTLISPAKTKTKTKTKAEDKGKEVRKKRGKRNFFVTNLSTYKTE